MKTDRNCRNHEFLRFRETRVTGSRTVYIQDAKNVCYIPLKRPEMPEITSFSRFYEIPVTGSRPFKSTLVPKTVCYSPRKQPEMSEITSFLRFRETRVTVSRAV